MKKKKKKNILLVYIEYGIIMSIEGLIRLLPMNLCYFLAGITARLIYIIDLKHRRRIIQHLMYAGIAKDKTEAAALARRNFEHFAKFAVEFVKCRQMITPDNIAGHVSFSGSEKSKSMFFSPGQSSQVIIVTSHTGNWELAGMIYTVFSGLPLLSVMRPFENPKISDYVNGSRSRHNHSVCPKLGALKHLYVALKKGSSISILSDQHASRNDGVETVFFGHPARTHASPAILHLRTGIPILVGATVKEADGFKYNVVLSEPIMYKPTDDKEGDIRSVAQLYTTEIEKVVAKYPEQWMWAHRRWLDINRGGR